jgi:hypothetical protein
MLRAISLFSRLVLAACFALWLAVSVNGQGKQAVVIMRSGEFKSGACEGAANLDHQILFDVKLNNKDEVRLFTFPSWNSSTMVSRKSYEDSGKRKLRDLYAFKWDAGGVLTAVSVSGQAPVLAVPDDTKPQKNIDQPLQSFYGVMLTGEVRDGKSKRKVDLPLRSVWKIFFVAEGAPFNDSLFNHVADEASVALWETYLRKTNNYRSSDANTRMHEALVQCARADLNKFVGGDFAALTIAKDRITRTQSIKDDEVTRQLAADISRAQQDVEGARNKTEQLIKSEKWDEAITAAEPITKYLNTWAELKKMYDHALEQSHEVHLNAADKAWLAEQLETSLSECSLAWKRLSNSERARGCVCRARNEIAVRDSKKNRQISKPKEAMELVQKQIADGDCPQDPRLALELTGSKCEYAQQLYAQARQLLGVGAAQPPRAGGRRRRPLAPAAVVNVKMISMANKKDFREAREKLILANELCPEAPILALLNETNRRLSDFCKSEAKQALARNDNGTAYVYLQKAQGYTPQDGEVTELLTQAREKFQEQTRVSVGVVFRNQSGNGHAEGLLSEFAGNVESASNMVGLSQATVLTREAAVASLRAIQAGRALNSPTVIFYGELTSAGARVDRNSYSVSSSYSYPNEERQRWDRAIDQKNSEYNNCKKQYGEAQCGAIATERQRMREHRDSLPRRLERAYSYQRTDFRLQGGTKLSFRSTDSISRATGTADTLSADLNGQCQQLEGVHQDDTRGAGNKFCQMNDEGTYLSQMFSKMQSDASPVAIRTLQSLPGSYYNRAQTAANKQQAIESYLRFLFLTSSKNGTEAIQARSYLVAYDPELSSDGILR